MSSFISTKKSGYLFMVCGVAFFAASFFAKQTNLLAVGAMFVCIGAALVNGKNKE